MHLKYIFSLIFAVCSLFVWADDNPGKKKTSGNPLFEGWYADPEGVVFGNEYWIYPTYSAAYKEQLFMDAFSSTDLVNWTKHPKVLSKENISWLWQALWAPAVLQANGKYYIFFGANDIQNNNELGGIGVAVADKPEGPFKDALGKPLIGKIVNGAQPIDQFVFKDDDGQYYMYYGGWGHCNVVKMAPDLLSIVPFEDGEIYKEVTPENYVEGPFMLKRDGKYYFMWSEGGWGGPDYCVAYAIADSPMGPFKREGKILQQDLKVATGAGHHSIVKGAGKNEWYIIYHRRPLGETAANSRATCIDRLYFGKDGKIKPVKMTFKGVKPSKLKATSGYSYEEVWQAYEGFNNTLLDKDKYIYKNHSADPHATDRWNGAAAIWCQPIYWDMAMNAYKLAKANKDKKRMAQSKELCEKIYQGNKNQYCGFDFDDNNENTGWFIYDDIMWWTISLARGYELFGNEEYLRFSEESFSRVWYGSKKVGDTGSYDEKEGGMFWQWQPIRNPNPNRHGDGKMACINFPTVVAAMTLYNNVPKNRVKPVEATPVELTREQYLYRAKEIYQWGVENLFDKRNGRIADSRHGNGNPAWKTHVYNQATFIGASVLLYKATGEKSYLDNAILAADYTVNEMSAEHNLLPFESGIEQGIYTAIFAQYIGMLVYDCGQTQYLPFLHRTIATGWDNRDRSRDVCGGRYEQRLPAGSNIDSYSASGIPAMMLVFPGDK